MKYRNLALSLGLLLTTSLIFLVSCKKINDYTDLGGDLIPAVDGITTFDTIIDVQAFNDTFTFANDSTRYVDAFTHYLGHIQSDPFFGRTDANLAIELKPPFFRYTFSNVKDSLHIDSVVLVLDVVDNYGDTTTPHTVNVYEIDQASDFSIDSAIVGYKLRENRRIKGALLGSRTFEPRNLRDTINAYQDTVGNSLRIRLDDAFGTRLLNYDTVGVAGGYSSDSSFRKKFKGFQIESTGGNSLIGINLGGAKTKLAIYYKDDNGDPGNVVTASWDTLVSYFSFSANTLNANAQYIRRDYSGTPLAASVDGTTGTPDNTVYIQSTPGSFAWLKIPGLSALNNRVVHRAELIMESIYDPLDTLFYPPNLYLDAFNPTTSEYQTIPYDFLMNVDGSFNLAAFGVSPLYAIDPSDNSIRRWNFNLTRYVQNIVNDNLPAYDLRLYAPLYQYNMYKPTVTSVSAKYYIQVNGQAGKGRVRLHGGGDGSVPGANPQRMRMRIIYSKL